MKTRKLTPEEHARRLNNGVCPRCGDWRLVRVMRTADDGLGGSRFAGAYYTCSGPRAHECYHLSGDTGTVLAESCDGVDPLPVKEPVTKAVPPVRRKKETS